MAEVVCSQELKSCASHSPLPPLPPHLQDAGKGVSRQAQDVADTAKEKYGELKVGASWQTLRDTFGGMRSVGKNGKLSSKLPLLFTPQAVPVARAGTVASCPCGLAGWACQGWFCNDNGKIGRAHV